MTSQWIHPHHIMWWRRGRGGPSQNRQSHSLLTCSPQTPHPVHEGDGQPPNREALLPRPHNHFHLEHIPLGGCNQLLHVLLIVHPGAKTNANSHHKKCDNGPVGLALQELGRGSPFSGDKLELPDVQHQKGGLQW